jgi:hypothetical protein
VLPVCTLALGGAMLTEIGGGVAVMVTVAISDLVLSATALAVSITLAGFGKIFGAVYVIDIPDALDIADSVPQLAALQPAPETDQLTPLFWRSPDTIAVTVVVAPVWIEKARGETLTETLIVPPFPLGSLDPQEARKKAAATVMISFLYLLQPVIKAERSDLLATVVPPRHTAPNQHPYLNCR